MLSRVFFGGVAALVSLAVAPPAQRPTYQSKVQTVRVEVSVTRRSTGLPERGLSKEDFEVLDNGARQDISLISSEVFPVSLVLVLDLSESVQGEQLVHLVDASEALLGALTARDQVQLVTFDHFVRLHGAGAAKSANLRRILGTTGGGGLSSLRDAIYAALRLTDTSGSRSLIVVFTDGLDTSSWLWPNQVLAVAARLDCVVDVVYTGRPVVSFLDRVTEATGGVLLSADVNRNLKSVFLRLLDDFKSRYVLGFPATSGGGWHNIHVRARNRDLVVKARPGYTRELPSAVKDVP